MRNSQAGLFSYQLMMSGTSAGADGQSACVRLPGIAMSGSHTPPGQWESLKVNCPRLVRSNHAAFPV